MLAHLLSLCVWIPAAAALILQPVSGHRRTVLRAVAVAASLVSVLFTLLSATYFVPHQKGLQLVEHAPWIPSIGAEYALGIDGISLLMLLLSGVVSLLAILFSTGVQRYREKEFYRFLLLLQTALAGTFASSNAILFFAFWQLSIVALYFLIGMWGNVSAAGTFAVHQLGGSALMLLGFVLGGHGSPWAYWLLLAGCALRAAIWPLQTWLVTAQVAAPTAGSMLLAGVLLKSGTYALLRIGWPLPSNAVWPVAFLGVLTILYGAAASVVQIDWKKILAYAALVQSGVAIFSLATGNEQAIFGSLVQQAAQGCAAALLFAIVGMIDARGQTRRLADLGGLRHALPNLARVFALVLIATAILPVTSGLLAGTFRFSVAFTALGAIGLLLSSAFLLWLWLRTMGGPLTNPKNLHLPHLTPREWLVITPLTAAALLLALYPTLLLPLLQPAIDSLLRRLA